MLTHVTFGTLADFVVVAPSAVGTFFVALGIRTCENGSDREMEKLRVVTHRVIRHVIDSQSLVNECGMCGTGCNVIATETGSQVDQNKQLVG